jgi:uncharacterized membrane protein
MTRTGEVSVAVFVGMAAGIAFYIWPTLSSTSDFRAIGTTLTSVAATLLGFLIAALALLASVSQHWFIRNLQRTPHFNGVLRDLYFSCAVFLLALVCGVISLLAPVPSVQQQTEHIVIAGTPLHIVTCLLLGLISAAFVTMWPVGRKFWFILVNLRPSGTKFEVGPPDESA